MEGSLVVKSTREEGKTLIGVFDDNPMEGLEYETQAISGVTNKKGEFKCRLGETATFSAGSLILGSALGSKHLTPAHLITEVAGDIKKIRNQKVTNIARFLQSLDEKGNLENNITISDEIRNIVKQYRYRINFDQPEEAFTADPNVNALFGELKRPLRTAAQARNHLRRTLKGIKKTTDVKIPTRDGSYLLADVFRPIEEGKYPVVMSLGAYGKAFWLGCICNERDSLKFEELEDNYFEGKPIGKVPFFIDPPPVIMTELISENFELANPTDWVPRGYVLIRVDPRGVGKTPGTFEQFSLQEAKDYYDAIEWAAKQEWSNGNVGLWGASYYAMNQYNVAQLQPPSLKAMIPIAGDIDSYRDYAFSGGGLYSTFNFIPRVVCGERKEIDWISIALANPFYTPDIYGPTGKICISADMSKVTVPFWSTMGLEGTIHIRGSSEAYILAASKHKKLTIISEPGIHFWTYANEFLESHMAFFDYWLKGIDNGIMQQPPVEMMIRTGWGGYYWQHEDDWPIRRTQYTKYYLDAAPATWEGDGQRHEFMKLGLTAPTEGRSITYSADVKWGVDPCWSYGVSFITDALPEDVVIAGYIKLVIWVASSSHDMQIHASVRVLDENDREVPYAVGSPTIYRLFPVGQGALKVSHRKLDPERSTVYRPYRTHLKEDYQPLKPGEIVEAEVEIWPTTALIRKGHRIRLDAQPASGCGIVPPINDPTDTTYQVGASNIIYTGPGRLSYLQLPVIPPKK
jgi:predicted acyl esterase